MPSECLEKLMFLKEIENSKKISFNRKRKYMEWVENASQARKQNNIEPKENQYDKAEELLTWYTFAPLLRMEQIDESLKESTIKELIKPIYPAISNYANFEIDFEKRIIPPIKYIEYLQKSTDTHPVRYVRKQADNHALTHKTLETPPQVDFLIQNREIIVAIEAKFTSDIDSHREFSLERNQIARIIDASIDLAMKNNPPKEIVFVLCIPNQLKNSKNRLYTYKMKEYIENPHTLGEDLPHRSSEELKLVKTIEIMTWEKIADVIYKKAIESNLISDTEKKCLKEFFEERRIEINALK